MTVFTAPESPGLKSSLGSLFLAGGITGCPDWQQKMLELVVPQVPSSVEIYNPRRADFDTSNPAMSNQQITWEYWLLRRARHILFWFPAETVCPITLFELGAAMERRTHHLYIGCHPDYPRRYDVEMQTQLFYAPAVMEISSTVEELAARVVKALG